MADLKTDELPTPHDQPAGPGGSPAFPGGPGWRRRQAALAAGARRAARAVTPAALWRSHRLFTILVLLSLVPRILAALSFRPALLTADSFLYMQNAANGQLGYLRPSGYSFFLAIFQGLPHALLVVTTLQHLMGIAIAVIVYALLRYWGLPGWGASLAAVPTLFDVRQVALESYILSDTVFALVIVVAAALLLTRRTPRLWQCVVAALLLAYASVLRGNGIPLVIVVAVFLLIRKVGWKACTAAAVAFVVPVLGYVLAFHSQYGRYNMTVSDGIFLWSRTTSFANCQVIKPPPDLAPLCPDREKSQAVPPAPGWSISYLLNEPTPSDYVWAPDVWWRHDAHPGINSYNDTLGRRFAIKAIEAQPGDYLKVVSRDVMLTFLTTDRPQGGAYLTFTPQPRIPHLPSYYQNYIKNYAGTTSNTHAVYPYAFFLFLYQQPVLFTGVLFLLVILAGLAGVLRNWRRWGGLQLLPWGLAAVSIVSPALVTQSLYRYTMIAIPLGCLAAGLGFAQIPGRRFGRAARAAVLVPAAAGAPAPGGAPAGGAPVAEAEAPASGSTPPAAPAPRTPAPGAPAPGAPAAAAPDQAAPAAGPAGAADAPGEASGTGETAGEDGSR
ncbi:MAG TPA: hypothetical protein VFV41_23860 [Streptosporangiaceae bacterium]|nr:hypothetical protein [Streptosporangiaceae bacterium]